MILLVGEVGCTCVTLREPPRHPPQAVSTCSERDLCDPRVEELERRSNRQTQPKHTGQGAQCLQSLPKTDQGESEETSNTCTWEGQASVLAAGWGGILRRDIASKENILPNAVSLGEMGIQEMPSNPNQSAFGE